jgi:monoamine oxidase
MTRVIVVGAGMAGLSAARALRDAGVECVVLEARDRLGGRLHTVDLADAPVDLGGSWVHTPVGNPLTLVAKRHGVALMPGSFLDELVVWDRAAGVLGAEESQRLRRAVEIGFPEWIESAGSSLAPLRSMADGIERFVADQRLPSTAADRLKSHLRAFVEADASGAAEDVSVRGWSAAVEYDGDPIGDLPVGGYRELVGRIAAPLDVRLERPVVGIGHGRDGVYVRTATGATEVGTHVIVSVPLGVLKARAIRFDPDLPAERWQAIDRVGFGRFEKLALRFDEPVWTQAGLPHILPLRTVDGRGISLLLGLDRFGVGPVLVAFAFGSDVGVVTDGSLQDAVTRVLELLRRILGSAPPDPTAAVRTTWSEDPFSRGAYTYVAVGAEPADLDFLAGPVGARLVFAGEHTTSARMGYADGAMATGLRAATHVLRPGPGDQPAAARGV